MSRASILDDVVLRLGELGGERADRGGDVHVALPAERIREAVRRARAGGFEQLSDVLAVDWSEYPRHAGPRFTVIYHLFAPTTIERLFLRVAVEDGEAVPSITPQWRGADVFEREVYDLFGIPFDGHPDLRKLVTPEDLDGHPLRKDFDLGESPTLFNDGRYLDPASFRAGMLGRDAGRTGWVGGARKGVVSERGRDAAPADAPTDADGGTP
ncbi:MAG: NADH-quinone oxidoreductase subunit C [Trueperaceae bacterium]|nr:NADH-quinone oxidoreductase subunit C [Trueperaceae bacterium]